MGWKQIGHIACRHGRRARADSGPDDESGLDRRHGSRHSPDRARKIARVRPTRYIADITTLIDNSTTKPPCERSSTPRHAHTARTQVTADFRLHRHRHPRACRIPIRPPLATRHIDAGQGTRKRKPCFRPYPPDSIAAQNSSLLRFWEGTASGRSGRTPLQRAHLPPVLASAHRCFRPFRLDSITATNSPLPRCLQPLYFWRVPYAGPPLRFFQQSGRNSHLAGGRSGRTHSCQRPVGRQLTDISVTARTQPATRNWHLARRVGVGA